MRADATRFLLYSHDGLGLGHVRRNLAIAGALADAARDAAILVVTSAEEVERLGIPPRVDVLRLPGLRKLGNRRYAARRLPLPWPELVTLRANLLAAAADSFRPDVVLADKHPLGMGGELRPALEAARAHGGRAVLGLRDILDEPPAVIDEWRRDDVHGQIAGHYDRVLIYGQREIADPVREYAFPPRTAGISHYTGYVVGAPGAPAPGRGARDPGRRPRILATVGGGDDGFALLAIFVEAAARRPWEAAIVSGPQCGEEPMRRLRDFAGERGVEFHRFVRGLSGEFGSLDALVCMGGYNTLVEAATSRVPTVCVPRVRPRREQLLRARAFAGRGLVRLLEPADLDVDRLGAAIESALRMPREAAAAAPLDLDGARRAAHHLVELAAAGPAHALPTREAALR